MAALTKATLSPTEKTALIRRHFPALLPVYDETRGQWIAPSQTERGLDYPATAHRLATGEIEHRCPCKATRACTHVLLIERLCGGTLMPGERVIDHTPLTASYNPKYDSLMRSSYGADGLA